MLPITSHDLLQAFQKSKDQFLEKQPILKIKYQEAKAPEYEMNQFDNRAAEIIRVIKSILTTINQTWQSWKNNTSQFTLADKLIYIKHVGNKIKQFNEEIKQLSKKVKQHYFSIDIDDGETYQQNVCRCLYQYLTQASNFFKRLEHHVDQKKRNSDKIFNYQARHSKEEQVKPKYQAGYKEQAEFLQKEINKSKENNLIKIQELLVEIGSVVEETLIEAFRQDDILIQFADSVSMINENVHQGNQNLKEAVKYEGEAKELWMWLFLSMTIMVIILDFVKK